MGLDHSSISDEDWEKIKDLSPHEATVVRVRETPFGTLVELLYPSSRSKTQN